MCFALVLLCFGLVGSTPEAALHLQEEKTTMGIWYSGFGIGNWQLATGNWQLATCSGVGRFYFYRYCLTIFPVELAVGRREMQLGSSLRCRAVPSHCCAAAPIIIIFAVAVAVVLLDIRLVIYFG